RSWRRCPERGATKERAGGRLLVLADLVANDAADRSATHGAEDAAVSDDRTGYAADRGTGGCTLFARGHVVPGCTAGRGKGDEQGGDEGTSFHDGLLLIVGARGSATLPRGWGVRSMSAGSMAGSRHGVSNCFGAGVGHGSAQMRHSQPFPHAGAVRRHVRGGRSGSHPDAGFTRQACPAAAPRRRIPPRW